MRHRTFFAAVLCGSVFSASLAAGAPQGRIPNFSPGANVDWRTDTTAALKRAELTGVTFFLPPPGEPQPVKLDPRIFSPEHIFNGLNMLPVADLTNPNLQTWVADALRAENERRLSGKPIQQPPTSRCWPSGLPGALAFTIDPTFVVQGTREILILQQHGSRLVRRIALNQRHSRNPKPSWFGESVGHYENGDTLVIDTIGLNDKTFVDYFNTPHTLALHVVERWKLSEDSQSMEVKVRVEDSGAFKAPFEMTQTFRRVDEPWREYACGENPYDILHQGLEPIPQADKPDF